MSPGHPKRERDLRGHLAISHCVVPEAWDHPWILQGTAGRLMGTQDSPVLNRGWSPVWEA